MPHTVAPELHGPRALPPGTPAPLFRLQDISGRRIALRASRGQRVVLVFFTDGQARTSIDLLRQCQGALPTLEQLGARLLAVSVEPVALHLDLSFPLLTDPDGAVARAYGVYWHNAEASYHAAFILDENETVRWSGVSPAGSHPDVGTLVRALARLPRRIELAAA